MLTLLLMFCFGWYVYVAFIDMTTCSPLLPIFQHGTVATSSETSVGTQPGGSVTSRTASETPQAPSTTSHHHTGAKFRHGLLQLMIHTIDPMHDGQYAGSPLNYLILSVFVSACRCDHVGWCWEKISAPYMCPITSKRQQSRQI